MTTTGSNAANEPFPDSKSDTSKSTNSPSARPYQDQPIEYRYLTYDTIIPRPLNVPSDTSKQEAPPLPPDIKKFSNPFDWPKSRKLGLIWISVIGTALTAYTAGMYSPGIEQMSELWHISRVKAIVGITIFTGGFAVAPMILAPFSELAGRRPVFVIAGLFFLVFQICSAGTHLYAGMLIARFGAGCASSTFSTMVGGVVADVYRGEDRNMPMAMFTGAALIGTGMGPMIAGFIVQHTTWRWVFWSHSIAVGILMVFIIFLFSETRGSVLLSRMAATLNTYYEAREAAGYYGVVDENEKSDKPVRLRWKVKADEERRSLLQMMRISMLRPFHFLFTEPVVFFFSLFISFSWSVLYLTFAAIPYIFSTVYGFNVEQANAVLAAISIAGLLMTVVSIWQERYAKYVGAQKPGPEQRLFFCCFEALAMPIGLFWLGWTATPGVPWIVPTIAVGVATVGIYVIYLSTFNYLADGYGPYASSAIAAQSFCRNLLGGSFPLFTEQMYRKLGIGGASSLLGGIAVLLTLVPWVLMLYGPRIRARSKICSQLMSE